MYYVYILKSNRDGRLYTGCTNNPKKRFDFHNSGKAKFTSEYTPFLIIFYEAFINRDDAFRREKWLKTGWGRNHLRTMLCNSLKI